MVEVHNQPAVAEANGKSLNASLANNKNDVFRITTELAAAKDCTA